MKSTKKLIYDNLKHVSIGSLDREIYERTITVNGVSKAYAMTGWRIGYMAASKRDCKACFNNTEPFDLKPVYDKANMPH